MTIENKIKDLSEDTGIPVREVKRLCLEAGADLMAAGKLVIRPKSNRNQADGSNDSSGSNDSDHPKHAHSEAA